MNRPLLLRCLPPVLILLLSIGAAAQYPRALAAEALAAAGAVIWLLWIFRNWTATHRGRIQRLNEALCELFEGKPVPLEALTCPAELAELSVNLTRLLRKLHEQSARLEAREAHYRQAFEANLVGTFFWDAEGRFTEVNAAFEWLTGFSRQEVAAGKVTWQSLVPAQSAEPNHCAWAELEATGRCGPCEVELVRKDGTTATAWCEARALVTEPKRGIGYLLDLSDREPAEAAHLSSAQRLRSIWERSVDGMVLTDRHGIVLAVNQSYCDLLETSPVEAVGRPVTEPYAESCDRQQLLHEYQRRFQQTPIDSRAEAQVTIRSGRRLDLEFIYSLIELRHGDPLYLSIVRNITARKQAERALQKQQAEQQIIFDLVPAMIWFKDAQNRILRINRPAAQLMGLPPDQIEGRSLAELHPEQAARYLEADLNVIRSGQSVLGIVESLRTAGGETRWLHTDRLPYRDELGNVIGVIVFARDITERRQAEAQRLEMERKLRETQKLESLGVMAGGIAHDFNNLLTAILGNASLAMMQLSESSPLFTYLRNIEKSSMHAADLCKQMLAYAGRGRFVLQWVKLNRLIEDTRQLLQISVSKDVRLDFELTPDLPLVEADPSQIQQVLLNLVTNAAEATGDKGGTVTIRTGSVQADRAYLATTYLSPEIAEGEYVFLEIADTGCGMSPETQARIFDPFFSTKFTGRGLGLAAVWGIVRGHKGALELQSAPGCGSNFRILLPRAKTLPEDAKRQDSPSLWHGSGTVLLVDDDENVRSVTGRMLESFGFTVLTASDGQHGVDTYARYSKDITVVLLDLTMPAMSGEEAFAEIRRIQPDVRVILISGYDEQQAVQRFAGKGLAGFIQKPFKARDLNARLQAILSANPELPSPGDAGLNPGAHDTSVQSQGSRSSPPPPDTPQGSG